VISEPGFWERADRFSVLADAEYLDRLNAATKTAERLGGRLSRSLRPDGHANTELVELLASRVYVLDCALAGVAVDAPTDVFVRVRPSGADSDADAHSFADQLAQMYAGWAKRRGMQVQRLDAPPGEHLLTVSGLGCGEILGSESGLHVLEHIDDERDGGKILDREHVRVHVVDRAPGPQLGAARLARLARTALDQVEAPTVIVRRYRPGPASLVRDSVRGYRTGRLDRVLAGDFDLFGGTPVGE
jgi:ATP-dependent Clp protease ATP-binding subunit ClpC